MEKALSLTVHNTEISPAIEEIVRERVARLEVVYSRLVGCSLVIEGPGNRHQTGGPFAVTMDLRVPGGEPLIVGRQVADGLDVAIRAAFDAATRLLEDFARRQRGDVKTHRAQARGRVARLFAEEGYGFLETADGREVYFHRNSLRNGGFDRLRPGDAVRFHEEQGFEGPRASTVHLLRSRPVPSAAPPAG
jgi:cold shock CspA family protein